MKEYLLAKITEYTDLLEESFIKNDKRGREFLIYAMVYYANQLDDF